MTRPNIFKASSPVTIWFVFFMFLMSSTAYSFLISVFFSKARTAAGLGIVIYLGGYFAYYGWVFRTSSIRSSSKQTKHSNYLAPPALLLQRR